MATWEQLNAQVASGNIDLVRRGKLAELSQMTGRPCILYAVEMFNAKKAQLAGGDTSINLGDRDGFFEVLRDISGDNLDVILHSPGGSPEATESIVKLLRSRFKNIRFIIPSIAKSAATMLAMSGDEIIVGEYAELGPTDPQMIINGKQLSPAHAILKQFQTAKEELKRNKDFITAWLPILQQYGPSLLTECKNALALTETLVKQWLADYMLKGKPRAKNKASVASKFLAGDRHLSHGRLIDIDELKKRLVEVRKGSECNPSLESIIQDINYTVTLTFLITPAFKIFENYQGKGMYKVVQQQPIVQLPARPGQFPNNRGPIERPIPPSPGPRSSK